jgi:hypothetical protein
MPKPSGDPPPDTVNARHSRGWDLDGTVPWDTLDKQHAEMFKAHCRFYGYPDEA